MLKKPLIRAALAERPEKIDPKVVELFKSKAKKAERKAEKIMQLYRQR